MIQPQPLSGITLSDISEENFSEPDTRLLGHDLQRTPTSLMIESLALGGLATQRLSFDISALNHIASLLDATLEEAPFSQAAQPAFHIATVNRVSGLPLLLTLWPGLRRVDVRLGRDCTWVCKSVEWVELYPGVEVLFRRREPPGGYLFVSLGGAVAMVA